MQHLFNENIEALTQASLIFILGVVIILSNLIVIATFINFRGPQEVINIYLLSLAFADLICGLVIVPLSIYPALQSADGESKWVYGSIMCRITGYIEVTLFSISMYTFMWISVDRYLAVRKPLRYETVQTKTRCQCWMCFTWVSAGMLCLPSLWTEKDPTFDKYAYICVPNWNHMAAYSITLCILVLGPSVISIVYNYGYIFSMMRKIKSGVAIHDKEYATALAENLANPSHVMSFLLVFLFTLSWSPYIGIRIYQEITGQEIDNPLLHFGVVWVGILNSFWKIIIMSMMSSQFRLALRIFFLTICCRTQGRLQAEILGLDPDD
ncbi:hypothetical protein PVAND_008799 [Polypedilum vanderplanki]|uniref:G-protein coupled receptors family 1 profile domain-containing protein n=1 Tax=Polypedilum vanderplanki TaxID=319348 RepID=A0A9J6CC71_POLVA|nr:hypothetical protein PVAND_008799 [Polypedilum vanderplanki]